MKAFVATPPALFRLAQYSIEPDWFNSFGLPPQTAGLKHCVVGDVAYIIDIGLESDSVPIVVVNLDGEDAVFNRDAPNSNTLERIITVARSIHSTSVVVPIGWRLHREGSLFSIQAPSVDRNWRARLHFELKSSKDLFVFSRTDEILNFNNLDRHSEVYAAARATLSDAILTPPNETLEAARARITLSQRLPQGFVQGASLDQWYSSKLTAEQRSFVDKPHDGPVRLRGSAGTGKTISLVVKFLRDAERAEHGDKNLKFGFLTHSSASVDLVTAIAESLDTTGLLHGQGRRVKLEVRTLYDLANEYLHFDLSNLRPLSLDGREGRRLQFELIDGVLREMAASPIVRAQFAGLSASVNTRWQAATAGANKAFVADIMSEFASVLDAEGIRQGEEKGERYARGSGYRPVWLMALDTEVDRRFVLDVHRRYRRHLAEMEALSVDQMVSDFSLFLDSNRWDRVRSRDGYDALFVDELHLFTSIERQTLHKLIKQNLQEDGRPMRPPIFMAYDLKQSPHDTFAQYGDTDPNLFNASTGLQNAELVKLERVFRYTPQIAEFLADLDAAFPAIDIPGDWDAYAGDAQLADGGIPELTVFQDELTLFKAVFSEAERAARSIDGGGRRVALLCASADQFDKYVTAAAGQFKDKHIQITSREPSSELRHAGKRFIFSMPEYVAGLQFDTVFLVHVDAAEAPLDSALGVRRKFISTIYLGASRAEKCLKIFSCLTRGGPSDILNMAIERKSLRQVTPR